MMCRAGLAVPGQLHARHFHPTGVTAAFAAAAVAGKLRGLDEDALVHAFGICGSQASGIIEYLADGSSTKRLHPGWGAHAGLVAVELAAAGFTGPETVFEGDHGFYAALAGGVDRARLDGGIASLGRTWELGNLTFKPYPCGSIAQPYMDCARELRARHALTPDLIATVRCRTAAGPVPRLWEPLAAKHRPPNGYAAKFSLPYLLAVVLTRGTLTLADTSDSAVGDDDLLALAARVSYEIDATIDYPRQFVGDVTVTTTDGRTLVERRDHPRGGPDDPMSATDLVEKFRANAALRLKHETIDAVVAAVDGLATAVDLRPLARALAS
jgi:2-methylcitrate dehydratase PrpD